MGWEEQTDCADYAVCVVASLLHNPDADAVRFRNNRRKAPQPAAVFTWKATRVRATYSTTATLVIHLIYLCMTYQVYRTAREKAQHKEGYSITRK